MSPGSDKTKTTASRKDFPLPKRRMEISVEDIQHALKEGFLKPDEAAELTREILAGPEALHEDPAEPYNPESEQPPETSVPVPPEIQLEIEKLRAETAERFAKHDMAIEKLVHAIEKLDAKFTAEIKALRSEVKAMQSDVGAQIEGVKTDMIRWVLATGLAIVGLVFAMLRFMLPS